MGQRTVTELDAAWFRACVERMADFVCAIDRDGIVVYANPATLTWLGVQPAELIGRSALDFVHPDDRERAAETIAYGRGSSRVEVPVTFRLRAHDEWAMFDVRGHGLGTDPDGETMLIVARESNGSELLDELLDNLAVGADFEQALVLMSRQLCRQLWNVAVAVVYRDEAGARCAPNTGLPIELVDALVADGESPWSRATRRGEQVVVHDLDLLPPELAAIVREAGFEAVIAVPVADPQAREPVCLVIFGADWLQPNLGLGVAIDRVKRLLRVALQQRHQREQLERSARTDPLTGIANRRRFFHRLELELEHLTADVGHSVAVVCLDLDGFKEVNDAYGHSGGDTVLREVAARLQGVVGDGGMAARLGGDEFALLVLDGDPDDVAAAAVEAIERPIRLPDGQVFVGASTGTSRGLQGDAAESVVERADSLAYDIKRQRREAFGSAT